MAKHPRSVEGYGESLENLARAVGNMTYDRTAEFIGELACDIERQAKGDEERGRLKLAARLYQVAEELYRAEREMTLVWKKICEPYMED